MSITGLLQSIDFVSILGLGFATLALYGLSWFIYARYYHPYSDIPGPTLASFSRLWIGASVGEGNAEHTQRALHKRYGHLVRIAHNEVSVSDPEAVKVIYNIKSGFTKTDFYTPFAPNMSPHGDLFTQRDEKIHSERRKYVSNIYSMSQILESERYIDSCGDVFLEKMGRMAKEGVTVDFGEWIQWYTFDVIGELFFGHQFGFMKDEHDFGNYIETLDTLLPGISMSSVFSAYLRPFHSIVGLLFPSIRKSIEGYNRIREAGQYWTNDRLEKRKIGKVARTDLLERMFINLEEKKNWIVPDIANEAVIAIFAGSDTTAVAIRSIFYHLMKTPATMARLVAEIDEFNSRDQLSHPHITYNEAIKMPYLVACCKEAMRLHPSVGLGMPRHVPAGGATICGRFFPEGSRVSMNGAVLHYQESVFGSDAHEFNPDRWLGPEAANMARYMLNFGGGTRTCIGKNISLSEMHKLVPTFLRRFEIELSEPDKEWQTHNFWFNKQTGINVKINERSKQA